MSNILVSIIIVTRGVKGYLQHCLGSIREQGYSLLEIIVIDNSLNPDFSRKISERYPEVRLSFFSQILSDKSTADYLIPVFKSVFVIVSLEFIQIDITNCIGDFFSIQLESSLRIARLPGRRMRGLASRSLLVRLSIMQILAKSSLGSKGLTT